MARSFGLLAYRAIAARRDGRQPLVAAPRPSGELLWIHCPEDDGRLAVQDLALRQIAGRPGLSVLITFPDHVHPIGVTPAQPGLYFAHICDEHPTSVAAFLNHWKPDCCIWLWGGLRPILLIEAAARECALYLINADKAGFDGRRDRWLPDVARNVLPLFSAVMARTPAAARRLTQLGLTKEDVQVTSALLSGGQALHCDETDLADLAAASIGRAIWFANGVQREELGTVLAAHRQALRLSHRLLLVLRPATGFSAADALAEIKAQDFRVLVWDDGNYPDETTQILLSEDAADVGLFYRVAPVSFLGGSLVAGNSGIDPLEAAALGSAILYGPRVSQHLQSYTRLAAAGAARIINDSSALGMAVTRLVAPDQAAAMAYSGWDVISEGAELMDRITDLIQDTLDVQRGVA